MKTQLALIIFSAGLCVGCDVPQANDFVPGPEVEPLCREAIQITSDHADALAKVNDRATALKYLSPDDEVSMRMEEFAKRWKEFKQRATEADKAVIARYDAEYRVQQQRVDAEMARIQKMLNELQKRYGTR